MTPEPSIQNEIALAFNQLAFLSREDWSTELGQRLDTGSAEVFRDLLTPAAEGLGYCIDERPIAFSDRIKDEAPKPAFVGGAAGWVVMFLMAGQSLEQAVQSTVDLYQKNNWGEMEIHTDDLGHLVGCGFLNVFTKVVATLQNLKLPGIQEKIELVEGKEIFEALKKAGARVVTLTGAHKAGEARVVINQVEGYTLDRPLLYADNPAFLWDAWATTGDTVRSSYNELSEGNLDADSFMRLQAAMHLATGIFLRAVKLEGEEKNVVMLSE